MFYFENSLHVLFVSDFQHLTSFCAAPTEKTKKVQHRVLVVQSSAGAAPEIHCMCTGMNWKDYAGVTQSSHA